MSEGDARVAGYYTLANGALDVALVPSALFGGAPPLRPPPILTLTWLGVDRGFAGRAFETQLFARALADGVRAHEVVPFVAVIVDALTEENARFYEGHGFAPVPGTTHKLYMPAATLLAIARG